MECTGNKREQQRRTPKSDEQGTTNQREPPASPSVIDPIVVDEDRPASEGSGTKPFRFHPGMYVDEAELGTHFVIGRFRALCKAEGINSWPCTAWQLLQDCQELMRDAKRGKARVSDLEKSLIESNERHKTDAARIAELESRMQEAEHAHAQKETALNTQLGEYRVRETMLYADKERTGREYAKLQQRVTNAEQELGRTRRAFEDVSEQLQQSQQRDLQMDNHMFTAYRLAERCMQEIDAAGKVLHQRRDPETEQ